MEVVIITGLSGSGKSLAINYLEDMGFFCIDNLPPQLLADLLRVISDSQKNAGEEDVGKTSRLALVMDARNPFFASNFAVSLAELKKLDIKVRILYLEAATETLIKRFKETRRAHPLAAKVQLGEAIALERNLMESIKESATDIIDTSDLDHAELKEVLFRCLMTSGQDHRIIVSVQSFGFKYGLPADCDNIWDVRFIPNPFYVTELRPLTGRDQPVIDYIMAQRETVIFLEKQRDFYKFVLPHYVREGKTRLFIGVGCTGGRHRSVMLAENLAEDLRQLDYHVVVSHRDMQRAK